MEVGRGFDVDGQDVGPGIDVFVEVLLRSFDHEVNVDRYIDRPFCGLYHRCAERQVGDEVAVHDIDVDPIGSALDDGDDLIRQPIKVRSQYGRRDHDPAHGPTRPSSSRAAEPVWTCWPGRGC